MRLEHDDLVARLAQSQQRGGDGLSRAGGHQHLAVRVDRHRPCRPSRPGPDGPAPQVRDRHPRGARLSIRSTIGVVSGARDNSRCRQINLDLDPAQLDSAISAYEAGGDKAVVEFGLNDPYGT